MTMEEGLSPLGAENLQIKHCAKSFCHNDTPWTGADNFSAILGHADGLSRLVNLYKYGTEHAQHAWTVRI